MTGSQEKLREYGPIQDTPTNGRLIQLLPTRTLPLDHLLEENWTTVHSYGHFRSVRRAVSLKDGSPAGVYAKSAERVFSAEPKILARGNFWWGGSRSGEKAIHLPNQPLVEERTVWEAIYLLELAHLGIAAERPQALVTHPNGNIELLVADLGNELGFTNCFWGATATEKMLLATGFHINDLQALVGETGRHIIDVNRWEWLPFTNPSHEALLGLIRGRIGQ